MEIVQQLLGLAPDQGTFQGAIVLFALAYLIAIGFFNIRNAWRESAYGKRMLEIEKLRLETLTLKVKLLEFASEEQKEVLRSELFDALHTQSLVSTSSNSEARPERGVTEAGRHAATSLESRFRDILSRMQYKEKGWRMTIAGSFLGRFRLLGRLILVIVNFLLGAASFMFLGTALYGVYDIFSPGGSEHPIDAMVFAVLVTLTAGLALASMVLSINQRWLARKPAAASRDRSETLQDT